MADKIKITLVKSTIRAIPKHRKTVQSMGFRKLNQSIVLPDNAATRGQINQIKHLIKFEEIKEEAVKTAPITEATPAALKTPVVEETKAAEEIVPVTEVTPQASKAKKIAKTAEATEAPKTTKSTPKVTKAAPAEKAKASTKAAKDTPAAEAAPVEEVSE